MSQGARFATIAFAGLAVAACGDGTFSMKVVELSCPLGNYDAEWRCKKPREPDATLRFVVNPQTRAVALIVEDDPNKNWYVRTFTYEGCAIVDRENWQCRSPAVGGSIIVGMENGVYGRYSHTEIGFHVAGHAGLDYWTWRMGIGRTHPK